MIKRIDDIMLKAPVSMRALVTIDADVNAERVIVMHRVTGDVYHNFTLTSPNHAFVVPYNHAYNNTLLVGILDDGAVYNCKFADGIMAESVNVNA